MQRTSTGARAPDWDEARLLLALCRAPTVSAAARALGVNASTVSRRLAGLEAALAVSLFDRSREGITPTEAAEQLLPVAEEMEGTMARFGVAAQGLERAPSGTVRLACPPDVAEVLVAPRVRPLLARYPALRLELDPGEAVRDLTRGEADLALRTVRPERGDLVVTRLTSMRWVLVAAPALARSLGGLQAWTDAPWVGWGDRVADLGAARWLKTQGPDVVPVVRTVSLRLQLALVEQGVGVSLLPEASARQAGLLPVRLSSALEQAAASWPRDDLFLVTHRALRQVPRIRVVWEDLLASCQRRRVP
jgi:DNA-binding transcriptional LysR family regulator